MTRVTNREGKPDVQDDRAGHRRSKEAARAEQTAIDLARENKGKLVLAHIDERIAAKGDMPSVTPHEGETEKELSAKVDALSSEGIDASVEFASVVLGGPGPAIVKIADAVDADVIVTGTRGRSSLTGLLVGSVTHKLMHISKRPVLAVPSD
jgi:nucleotide-binding universal stress UspA family protein